ncbi:MAG: hypothetical protein ACRDD7_12980 [Peptostreptococcaceae bacterium]
MNDFNSIKTHIKNNLEILINLLDEKGAATKRGNRGKSEAVSRCIFHGGDSYNLHIFKKSDGYHFSCKSKCGKYGDVFDLLEDKYGLSIKDNPHDVYKFLNDRFNLGINIGINKIGKTKERLSNWAPQDCEYVRTHIYYDKDGNPVQAKVIYKNLKEDKKWPLIYKLTEREYDYFADTKGDKPTMIYNLNKISSVIKNNSILAITEGEKDADTLCSLGIVAISPREDQDIEVLSKLFKDAGIDKLSNILIFKDNDEAGDKRAYKIKESIVNLWKDKSSRVLKIIPCPLNTDGSDISDYIDSLKRQKLSISDIKKDINNLIDKTPDEYSVHAYYNFGMTYGGVVDRIKHYFPGKIKVCSKTSLIFTYDEKEKIYKSEFKDNVNVVTSFIRAELIPKIQEEKKVIETEKQFEEMDLKEAKKLMLKKNEAYNKFINKVEDSKRRIVDELLMDSELQVARNVRGKDVYGEDAFNSQLDIILIGDKYYNMRKNTSEVADGKYLFSKKIKGIVANSDNCPEFKKLVNHIATDGSTGKVNEEVKHYVEMVIGSSLTGYYPSFINFTRGLRDTGKTTLFQTLYNVIGSDFGMRTNANQLLTKIAEDGRHQVLFNLSSVRYLFADECSDGLFLDDGFVKTITKSQHFDARGNHRDMITILNQLTICIATNNMPRMKADPAVFEKRLAVIEVTKQLKLEEMDERLLIWNKNNPLYNERPQILRYMLDLSHEFISKYNGLIQYQQLPESIKMFTSNSREDAGDVLADFMDEWLVYTKDTYIDKSGRNSYYSVSNTELIDALEAYCHVTSKEAPKYKQIPREIKKRFISLGNKIEDRPASYPTHYDTETRSNSQFYEPFRKSRGLYYIRLCEEAMDSLEEYFSNKYFLKNRKKEYSCFFKIIGNSMHSMEPVPTNDSDIDEIFGS